MSIAVMNRVWADSRQKGSALLVLLAIADNANDEGEAFPSEATIAAKARLSERQVRRIIQTIAGDGELEVAQQRRGRSTVNVYRVISPGQDVRLTADSPGQNTPVHPDIAMSAEPSRNLRDPSNEGGAVARELVGFYFDNAKRVSRYRSQGDVPKLVKSIQTVLADGLPPSLVKAGIVILNAKGLPPTALASAITEAQARGVTVKQHVCPSCGVAFASQSRLLDHQENVHW